MAFNRRVITKELDMANLAKHNDNYTDIKTELDAHDTKIAANKSAQKRLRRILLRIKRIQSPIYPLMIALSLTGSRPEPNRTRTHSRRLMT